MSRSLLKALIGERRGGTDRRQQQVAPSGPERRSGESRRRERIRRAHQRRLAPIGAGAVRAVLVLDGGLELRGSLWDLSEGGLCLAIPGHLAASCGDGGQVTLYDPVSPECVALSVEVRWLGSQSHDAFLGLRFSGATPQLQPGTFLDDYLDRHWSD